MSIRVRYGGLNSEPPRVAFRQAVVDGMQLDTPASAVSTLDDRRELDAPARRPFDEAELRTLLSVAKGEWRVLVLGSLYTGQRIGDLTSLTRRKVDRGGVDQVPFPKDRPRPGDPHRAGFRSSSVTCWSRPDSRGRGPRTRTADAVTPSGAP